MTPINNPPVPEASPKDRVAFLRRRFSNDSEAVALESTGGFDEMAEPTPFSIASTDQVDATRDELRRIVREYLGDQKELYTLVDEIAKSGSRGMKMLQSGRDEEVAQDFDAIGALEAIVRTDGSRPSFLIMNDAVDKGSSPVGEWEGYLDADEDNLRKVIACVGRIDAPSLHAGYVGTGFLIQDNLIVTNRHVLQGIGKESGGEWTLQPNLTIDFGHEFRGRDSVKPRRIRSVAFAGSKVIVPPVDHAKLDLAILELEPDGNAGSPDVVLSVDASVDWNSGSPDIYTIGYPFKPQTGLYKPTLLEQLFQQTYGHKRLAPGSVIRSQRSGQPWTVAHDATTLGGNSGSVVVVAGRPVVAAGLHYGGFSTEPAENWGHILGQTLNETDAKGRKLGDVLEKYGVQFTRRNLSPGDT